VSGHVPRGVVRREDLLEFARAALTRYDVGEPSVVLHRRGENTIFRVETEAGRRFALRLHRPGYQSASSVRSELEWASALRDHGVRTPSVMVGSDGEPVQKCVGSRGDVRLAVLFEWVQGPPMNANRSLNPWVRLGETIGRIHDHGQYWRPPSWFVRHRWDAEALAGANPRWGRPELLEEWTAEDRRLLGVCREVVLRRLRGLRDSAGEGFGLIHADLHPGNVLVGPGGSPVVIDFDDCGYGWFLYELAVALFPTQGVPGFTLRRDGLITGYRRVHALPDDALAELPTFLMARRLAALGWTHSRGETQHAGARRATRVRTTPRVARCFLDWASRRAQCG